MKTLLPVIALFFASIASAQNIYFSGEVRRTGDLAPIPGKQVKIRDVNDPTAEIFNTVHTQSNGAYFLPFNTTGGGGATTLQVVVTDCNGSEVLQTVQYLGGDTSYLHTITVCHNPDCSANFFPYIFDQYSPTTVNVAVNTELVPPPTITLNWGDGSQITGNIDYIHSNNEHTYATEGFKNICVTVDNGTCVTTKCIPQWAGFFPGTITAAPCSTSFDYIYTGYDDTSLEYYVNAKAPADSTMRFMWFVNGVPDGNTSPIENSTFATVTDTAVTIALMTYKQGCINTVSQTIPIDTNLFNNACFEVYDTVSAWAYGEAAMSTEAYNLLYAARMYSGVKNPINIQLYNFNWADSVVTLHAATESKTGMARFANVPHAAYIGRALYSQNSPEYGNYMPTYYGIQSDPNAVYYESVPHWYEAIPVGFDGVQYPEFFQNFSFTMLPITCCGGNGQVGGGTDWQDTLLRSSTVVEDVTVWAQNIANGKIYGYDITDANGSFTIGNLPYGTYYIDADYPGYYSTHDTITISAGNEVVNDVHIEIMEDMPTIGITETGVVITALYPNPTNGNTTLVLNTTKAIKTSLQIINMMGQTVYSENLGTLAGKKTVELTTQHLPAGIYYVTLYSGNNNTPMVKKLIKF